MKGIIDYLLSDEPNARILRDRFIFKVGPSWSRPWEQNHVGLDHSNAQSRWCDQWMVNLHRSIISPLHLFSFRLCLVNAVHWRPKISIVNGLVQIQHCFRPSITPKVLLPISLRVLHGRFRYEHRRRNVSERPRNDLFSCSVIFMVIHGKRISSSMEMILVYILWVQPWVVRR